MGHDNNFAYRSATAALLLGTFSIGSALAAEPVPTADPWWVSGYIETGGRAFLNNPQRNGAPGKGESLAGYYQYSKIGPGAFLDGYLATGSKDGVYDAMLWGTNVGYADQNIGGKFEKAGEAYLNFDWDRTPHVYSTDALTIYNGVGTAALTLPPGFSNALRTLSGNTSPISPANVTAVKNFINANEKPTDIGIKRDTASFDFRYTPNSQVDVKANYSTMHREGTQVDGVVFTAGTSGVTSQVTKPVNDTTENYGLNGEWVGSSPWDQKLIVRGAYTGSTYTDDLGFYTVQNPFCLTTDTTCARTSAPTALMGLPPSNQANGLATTVSADLPLRSRYVANVSYEMMRQNQGFLPFTINGNPALTLSGQQAAVAQLPAASLNGAINSLLINNVVTTQITPELRSKATYRYYDYDNQTPELVERNYIIADVATASATTAQYAPVRSLQVSYTKQNVGEDLNWRPTKEWNLGATYGFERYNWNRTDVDVTDENSGKVYADWKPLTWITARSSLTYSERRYDNYNYPGFVGNIQWLTLPANYNPFLGGSTQSAGAYRQFYLDNRDRTKFDAQVNIDVFKGVTVTPTFTMLEDEFNLPSFEEGLTHSRSYRTGVEVLYLVSPATRLFGSYMFETSAQGLQAGTPGNFTPTSASQFYTMNVQDRVKTAMVGLDQNLIPQTLDLKVSYTYSDGLDHQMLPFSTSGAFLNYPDVTTNFQRFDAQLKYYFDDDLVRRLGWTGKVTATLRYAYERNAVSNWQDSIMQNYMYSSLNTGLGYMTWLAYDNPNYNVQLISASLGFKW